MKSVETTVCLNFLACKTASRYGLPSTAFETNREVAKHHKRTRNNIKPSMVGVSCAELCA